MVPMESTEADALPTDLDPDAVGGDAEDLLGEDDGYEWTGR